MELLSMMAASGAVPMRNHGPVKVPIEGLGNSEGSEVVPARLAERIERVLVPESFIKERVEVLAQQIIQDYRDTDQLTVLIVLDGAVVFACDLGREIHRLGGPEIHYDFIKTRTYGDEIKQEGEAERTVEVLVEPRPLKGKHVLVVDDVLDQGFTLFKVTGIARAHEPSSLRVCTLLSKRLDKPTEVVRGIRESLDVSYVGFEVPDRWVAGYGIDVSGDFRELPFVVVANEEYYLRR
jgi:hypoxanthine phosphoribosyltransferase